MRFNADLFRGLSEKAEACLGDSLTTWDKRRELESEALLEMAETLRAVRP